MRMFISGDGGWDIDWIDEGKKVAIGLTDHRKYNGFVPLMDEGDPLKTAVMRVFSGLQVRLLNQNVQTLLFFRSLCPFLL